MADKLEKAKSRIDQKFLGRGGIHGVGLQRSKKAVKLYVSKSRDENFGSLLKQVREQAAPFNVIVVPSAPAVARSA
jgi:hypothetical protein